MSLPSQALFVKNNRIVGVGSINCGWFVSAPGLYSCIEDGMDEAWERYREGFVLDVYSEKRNKYFTTKEDLKNFDYMIAYEFTIASDTAYAIYNKELSLEDFTKLIDAVETNGIRTKVNRITDAELKTLYLNSKQSEDNQMPQLNATKDNQD